MKYNMYDSRQSPNRFLIRLNQIYLRELQSFILNGRLIIIHYMIINNN